jgi:molybdopterin converting factor small subunit
MSMHVQLKFFASLGHLTPPNADRFPVSAGKTVQDLLDTLHVPLDEVQLVFINGVKQDMTTTLKPGDRVGIFPPIGGG